MFSFLLSRVRQLSLAQCFLWWWGSQWNIRSVGVGNVLQLHRDWLSVLSLMGTLRHRKIYRERLKIQAPWVLPQSYVRSAHPRRLGHWPQIKLCQITLYVPYLLIGLIMSISYFQNLSQQASSRHHESSRQSTGKYFSILVK